MPAKSFIIAKSVDKDISKLPSKIQTKIESAFDRIKENPISGIKLHGQLDQYYKLRVGDYRIVYSFDARESTVTVVKVEHRQGVYK